MQFSKIGMGIKEGNTRVFNFTSQQNWWDDADYMIWHINDFIGRSNSNAINMMFLFLYDYWSIFLILFLMDCIVFSTKTTEIGNPFGIYTLNLFVFFFLIQRKSLTIHAYFQKFHDILEWQGWGFTQFLIILDNFRAVVVKKRWGKSYIHQKISKCFKSYNWWCFSLKFNIQF